MYAVESPDKIMRKYHSKFDIDTFRKDSYHPIINSVMLTDEDVDYSMGIYKLGGAAYALCLSTSILITWQFFHKIPFLNEVENKWARLSWKGSLIIGPLYLTTIFISKQYKALRYQLYRKYYPRYKKFKLNGDLRDLNPNVTCK